jgi:hypothetical protein
MVRNRRSRTVARNRLDISRLAEKVAWEGGVLEAIDYGIQSSDIEDEEVARLWAELEDLYADVVPLLAKLDLRIRQARAA